MFIQDSSPNSVDAVKYNLLIRLKHNATEHFLASLDRPYCHPGNSGQQMVVASLARERETLWIVKGPHPLNDNSLLGQPVKHGDKIRLEHMQTTRNLHSHGDRQSPITKYQEVTAYGFNGIGDANDDWIVKIEGGGVWEFGKEARLVHALTNKILHSHSGHQDPILTAGEQEVVGYPYPPGDSNDIWLASLGVDANQAARKTESSKEEFVQPIKKRTVLDLISIAGSIASITGWTLVTITKSFQAVNLEEIISYFVSSLLLVGLVMVVISTLSQWKTTIDFRPRPMLWMTGFWFVVIAALIVGSIFAWRIFLAFTANAIAPLIKYGLGF
jgi:hypothetical protein